MILNHLIGELYNIGYVLYYSILKDFIDEQQRTISMLSYTNITWLLNNFITVEQHHVWTNFRFAHIFSITDFQMCEKREHTRSCSKREEVCNMDFGDCWKPANWILEQYDFFAELKSTNGQRTISLLLSTSVLDTLIAEEQRYSYWTIALFQYVYCHHFVINC